jgi:hypothetical protein
VFAPRSGACSTRWRDTPFIDLACAVNDRRPRHVLGRLGDTSATRGARIVTA